MFVNVYINNMNKKEIEYQTALDLMFKYKCHDCGCTPKPDQWANDNNCMDCYLNSEEERDDCG